MYLITEHMQYKRIINVTGVWGRKWSTTLCSDVFLLPAHTIMMYSRVSPTPVPTNLNVHLSLVAFKGKSVTLYGSI